jgi:hypothetical protein
MGLNAVRFTGENHGEVLRFAFPTMGEAVMAAMQRDRLPVVVGTAQGPTRVKPWDWVVRHEDGTLEVVDQIEFMRRQW